MSEALLHCVTPNSKTLIGIIIVVTRYIFNLFYRDRRPISQHHKSVKDHLNMPTSKDVVASLAQYATTKKVTKSQPLQGQSPAN